MQINERSNMANELFYYGRTFHKTVVLGRSVHSRRDEEKLKYFSNVEQLKRQIPTGNYASNGNNIFIVKRIVYNHAIKRELDETTVKYFIGNEFCFLM